MTANGITKTQSRAFIAAWLGWCFDGLDGFLYSLVALPFVTQLLNAKPGAPEAATKASLIQGVFLIGWALGGAVFGRIGDRIGRSRTLTLTILIYACFTGLAFVVHTWWELLIVRFIAALGIGGEWAAGSALVSETLPPKYKHFASATLQNGYIVGMIAAAVTVGLFKQFDPRYVFLVGIVPALATVWIRKAIPEPEVWEGERKSQEMPPVSALFKGEVLKTTLYTLALTGICLTCVWALLYFSSQVVRGLPEVKAMAKEDVSALISKVTIVYCLWNIAGCYTSSFVARYVGYRKAFALFMACSGIAYYFGFKDTLSLDATRWWLNIAFFFSSGIFALFPLYVPPLFPTLVRTTGAGFSYNFGRLVAGIGTFVFGMATSKALSPSHAIWYASFLYIPGVILAFFVPVPSEGRPATGSS